MRKNVICPAYNFRAHKMAKLSLIVLLQVFSLCVCTVLDDYVNKPDPYYSYRAMKQPYKGDGFTTYFINMTSQKWLTGVY